MKVYLLCAVGAILCAGTSRATVYDFPSAGVEQIQPVIDLASSGDEIRIVYTGNYDPFTLDKDIDIYAVAGQTPVFTGYVTLNAGSVKGLRFVGDSNASSTVV